jgi:NAD(P)-dependent dehydrogenase (short-subunit alcohol dehydrogenase family)
MYNPFNLEGKTVLVTGASSGLGQEIAVQCSNAGASIIITGRNISRLEETEKMLVGKGHQIIAADISDSEGIEYLINHLPILNGVVHCAGILKRLPLKFISDSNLNELMRINFFAPAVLTQQLYKKKLLSNESSLVFISSVASSFASLGNIMYMSSKGALNSFVKGIAFELSSSGIRANAIQPGMVKTHLTAAIPDDEIAKDIARYPLGRYGLPEEIAYSAIYLLSDATKWMTGSILTIDGGLTLR